MLHYINNIFNSNAKNFNKFYVIVLTIVSKLTNIFFKLFQKQFTKLYSILLQVNLLPLGALTNMFKYILVIFANLELWSDLLSKIKNNSNIYLLRQTKYNFLHNY